MQFTKFLQECLSVEEYKIKNTRIPVIIIKRILIAENSQKTLMTSVLTRSGYMLRHSWGNSTKCKELMIKKSMRITDDGVVYNDTMLHLKQNWDTDIRFKSMYLDKVVSITKT